MYGCEIVEGRDHQISMGILEFETSPNTTMVRIMLQLTRALWSTEKAVIMGIGLGVLILLL